MTLSLDSVLIWRQAIINQLLKLFWSFIYFCYLKTIFCNSSKMRLQSKNVSFDLRNENILTISKHCIFHSFKSKFLSNSHYGRSLFCSISFYWCGWLEGLNFFSVFFWYLTKVMTQKPFWINVTQNRMFRVWHRINEQIKYAQHEKREYILGTKKFVIFGIFISCFIRFKL